jgi:hypothetical protein
MGRSTSSAPVRSYDATRRRRVRADSRSHARNVPGTAYARLAATGSSRRVARTSAARSTQSGAADCVADHTRWVSTHRARAAMTVPNWRQRNRRCSRRETGRVYGFGSRSRRFFRSSLLLCQRGRSAVGNGGSKLCALRNEKRAIPAS